MGNESAAWNRFGWCRTHLAFTKRMFVRERAVRWESESHDERADRPLGRSEGWAVAGIVPSRRNSWLKVMRLPETVSGEVISCGSELAMDTRRVSIAWRVLSRGFVSGTPINWRGPTWNTVPTPPRRTADRGYRQKVAGYCEGHRSVSQRLRKCYRTLRVRFYRKARRPGASR